MAGKKIIPMKPGASASGGDTAARRDGSSAGRSLRRTGTPDGAESRGDSQAQLRVFEQAMKLFRAGKFADAKESFQRAIDGPAREIAYHARTHVRMCDRRLDKGAVQLRTPEDHYNYAITLINTRNLAAAREHLEAALRLDAQADHVHYALALCRGLTGDVDGACENLKRAIELQPRNRIAARQDADFAPIAGHPLLQQILYPERNSA